MTAKITMRTFTSILLILMLASLAAVAADTAGTTSPQPVFIVLYSRFYDHSHQHTTNDRLSHLLPMLDKLHDNYPQSGISALLQFSGTVSELLAEENPGAHLVDRVKAASARGMVDVGYTGEEEPSYLYRPRPNLLAVADTPEARWAAKAAAAERFLTDFKNPVTGQPVDGLSGGLKRTQQVFGPAAFVTGLTTTVSGDSWATHELRKFDPAAMLGGIPPADPRRGIEGFGGAADGFSKFISPIALTSPEVYWEDGVLRLSDTSLSDNKPHSTDESVEDLKKFFAKLDRSKVRVIKLEVATYKRYLTKRADGSVLYDPMEWLYFHPDQPKFPPTMKPLVLQQVSDKAYRNEEQVMEWLLTEFLPANQGSRFLSVHELARMAENGAGLEVSRDDVRAIAADIDARFKEIPMQLPRFVRAGARYFSDADAFQLLASELAGLEAGSSAELPASVKLTHIYGPLEAPEDLGPMKGAVTVADVIHTAARLAPALTNDTWKTVPDNAVPAAIQVGSLKVNASQFLHLMAWSCLDPKPDRVLQLSHMAMTSEITFMYPKNTAMRDQGNAWTFKPAPLKLPSNVVTTAAR